MRSVAPGENSRQMQQLLQGVRTAALSAALERSDDLERLARAIDAARERRVADGEDDR